MLQGFFIYHSLDNDRSMVEMSSFQLIFIVDKKHPPIEMKSVKFLAFLLVIANVCL